MGRRAVTTVRGGPAPSGPPPPRPARRQVSELTRRAAATGAVAGVLGGTVAVVVAVVAGPGPGLTGYVSEAGVAGSGYATTYRSGVFALAVGLLLIAVALPAGLRPAGTSPADRLAAALPPRLAAALPARLAAVLPTARAAVALLVAGSVCTTLSGAVTCSDGCPLPPFEPATTADLVHGGASVLAVAAVVFAMVAIAWCPVADTRLRRVATVGALVALPLAAMVGLAMLLTGRGALVGVLERLLLAETAGWGLVTATLLSLPARPVRW